VKEKVKPAEILCRLNAQHGKETLSFARVFFFFEGHKGVKMRQLARSWQMH
jgi:hypothetical protein